MWDLICLQLLGPLIGCEQFIRGMFKLASLQHFPAEGLQGFKLMFKVDHLNKPQKLTRWALRNFCYQMGLRWVVLSLKVSMTCILAISINFSAKTALDYLPSVRIISLEFRVDDWCSPG